MPQLHAVVHGRVQGVNFRAYAVEQAQRLQLTGWVRNLPDRTVEVLAVGPRHELEEYAAWLHRGSPAAWVEKVDVSFSTEEAERFSTFDVRYE